MSKTDRIACTATDSGPCQFRVWPDGTVQSVEDGEPYRWMSDDYLVLYAHDEDDALDRFDDIERQALGLTAKRQDAAEG